jgi:hypothetical protein
MVAHTCNPSTQEAEAGESQVQDQPRLHSKTLSQSATRPWAPPSPPAAKKRKNSLP